MSNILDNSIWPNSGGKLGEIKVQIPTGTADDPWPTGDALVGNFVYDDGDLVGFVDTKALILNDGATTTIDYDYVRISLPNISEGELTINRGERSKYFNVRYGISVQGDGEEGGVEIDFKYKGCKTYEDVKAKDANYWEDVVDGVWSESLADLERGRSINYGMGLFTYGGPYNGAIGGYDSILRTFKGNLSSLKDGDSMFMYAQDLERFESDLGSLINGSSMFMNCRLDTASVQNIAATINDVNSLENYTTIDGYYVSKYIAIDTMNYSLSDEEKVAFNEIVAKGWTVSIHWSQYTPSSVASTMTLDENGEEVETPIPFYAKPIPSDEAHAKYVDAEGNFFNVFGGNHIFGDDLSTYGMFTCLEDAVANMRLTKIEK